MTNKTYRITLWTSVIGTIVLVVAGMVWLANGGGQSRVYVPGINEITADDHVYGPADAKVTLVEYADYQCPACGIVHATVAKLKADYGNRVRFVFRNFPIPGHFNGPAAAYAAEAAGKQGKFFEMSDAIFSKQAEWSPLDAGSMAKTLDNYARNLGLEMGKFHEDQASAAVKAKVEADAQSGLKAGVDSTPSFFMNGVRTQARSYDEFKSEFDAALAK